MHILTAIISILAVIGWGDWRNWKKYHDTLLFFALGNLVYNFLTANYFLWRMHSDLISNHTLTEMIYTFIVFPATGILFLGNYPKGAIKQILHTLQWIFIYGIWEYVFTLTGHIEYQYGWTFGWSIFALFLMFSLLRLHVKHPLLTYVLFALVSVGFLWWFDVPVHLPVEERGYYRQ
ncbi:CBO0543 family protein [Halalkalibacter alkalisediminis]|uniref:CBO0543 family protein n=1 Tax=Halalkalibacter alkalisediminis TaxID=935616 RepID=A0ABV6NF34_9BACI|nr:CBO0543 family protein [Halalkalibacter alkalisediminis]